jgi:hypothetical protein
MICAVGKVTSDELCVVESPQSKPYKRQTLNEGGCQVEFLPINADYHLAILNIPASKAIVEYKEEKHLR